MSLKWCGWCVEQGEWKVNSEGGYGRKEMWACTACLRTKAAGCVPRLLECYSPEAAKALQEALA